jgi:hypothetical protein
MHEAQRGNFSWNVLSCFLNAQTLSQICNCLSSKCNEKKRQSKSKHLLVRVGVVVTTQRKLTTKQSKAERQQEQCLSPASAPYEE